jgi:hypothetical protein
LFPACFSSVSDAGSLAFSSDLTSQSLQLIVLVNILTRSEPAHEDTKMIRGMRSLPFMRHGRRKTFEPLEPRRLLASGVYLYDRPPPLPNSDPAATVEVSNVTELLAAVGNLQSGQTVEIAAGTYNLSGITDAINVPQGITNWAIRGATGNRDDVIIKGAGMTGNVRFGIWMSNSPNGTLADFTVDGTADDAIIVNPGCDGMLFHNLRIVDSGAQFLKSNPDANGNGNDDSVVEYCVFEFRTTDIDNYANALSLHGSDGWTIRHNLFQNFLNPVGRGLAGPALLVWNGSSNTVVDGNTFINCARGISLGLVDKADALDHEGGIITNNVFYRDPGLPQAVDVPIYVGDSPGTKIFHNTVLVRGSYPNAIEYRFPSTTGLVIKNNLTDARILARDGAKGEVAGNNIAAKTTWFVDVANGDLHLLPTAPVIDQAVGLAEVTTDVDGQPRGASPDVGADEYSDENSVDRSPPVVSSITPSSVTSTGTAITWHTNEASDTQIEYGLTTEYGEQLTLDGDGVTFHRVELAGLQPNTAYHFRVHARDAAGNVASSGDHTFTTAKENVYLYDHSPALAPPDPAATITVTNVGELLSAAASLQSGQTIELAAGTYNLAGVAQAIFIPQGITNWSIRGATGNRDEVVIKGGGMAGGVLFGIWMRNSPNGTLADFTIDGTRDNAIIVNSGCDGMLFHNLRVIDSGSQFIKSNPDGNGVGNNNGIVEYCVFEYRTTDSDNYTNGVDVHAGDGWIVRHNLFRNFLSPVGQGLAGPAVLAWNGSSNTIVDGNTFINCARGVSLGLIDKANGFDHEGGLIVNNVFYRDRLPQSVDVPIFVGDSPGTKVLHNTVLAGGSYPSAIEYRFASSTGLEIKNNLTDAPITARNGADGDVDVNRTDAVESWFENVLAADLHLVADAPVIGQAATLPDAPLDVDGNARGGAADFGADEYPDDQAPAIGTSGDDVRYIVMSDDGLEVEIYGVDPGDPNAEPLARWPRSDTQPPAIDLLEGNDVVYVNFAGDAIGLPPQLQIDFGAGENQLHLLGGLVQADSIATGGRLDTTIAAGELRTGRLNQHGLKIDTGGRVALVTEQAPASIVQSLEMAEGAVLDIGENALIVDYDGPSPLEQIRASLASGRGGAGIGNGAWNGAGIISSAVAALNQASGESHAIGYADNATLPLGRFESFHGQPVDDTSILLAPAVIADANLDGVVNGDDATVLGAFYGSDGASVHWQFGDFDYNGRVDDDDVTLLGAVFGSEESTLPPPLTPLSRPDAQSSIEVVVHKPLPPDSFRPLPQSETVELNDDLVAVIAASWQEIIEPRRKSALGHR